ncbi:hypothetical protein BRADI_3g28913v3 [Brachypodium distachyon]|uniref:Uncharacterized protein n=1 Tax=Brachypodium distachyon TaxID=15368 RepID=A0A0Q3FBL2_BRADI|nr:hypothetical protein BRADI_3g28913v3 [Brachypodium distachyon]
MRQKILFLKRFDSELLYRFSLTLSVSTNNSKYLDFFRTGPSLAMIRSTSFSITLIRKSKDSDRMDMENTGFSILAGKGGKRILN